MVPARIEPLERSKARLYLRRGDNLLAAARTALSDRNADAAAVAGVQCAVSYADSFTIAHLSQRCRGQDHHEAIALIARCPTPVKGEVSKILQQILNRKSEVEYGSREVRMSDAKEIVGHAATLAVLVGNAVSAIVDE